MNRFASPSRSRKLLSYPVPSWSPQVNSPLTKITHRTSELPGTRGDQSSSCLEVYLRLGDSDAHRMRKEGIAPGAINIRS